MNFGIVGTNFISNKFCDAARQVEGVCVRAVYSRTNSRGEAFAKAEGIDKVYTDYSEMLSDPSIDAIYIASPTFLHAPQAIQAVKRGKCVLCEKMMASTLDEFYEMKRASDAMGVCLIEAMRPAYDKAYDVLRENLSRIGSIRRVSFEFCQYSSRYDSFKCGEVLNAFNPKLRNSALADIGIYPLHMALSLFGMPMTVSSHSVFLHNGFEGQGTILLGYTDMTASITYSKISDSITPSVIEGELGTITVDKLSTPTEIFLKLRGEREEKLSFPTVKNNMIYEISAFRDMTLGKLSAAPYLHNTECAQIIVDEVYRKQGITRYF